MGNEVLEQGPTDFRPAELPADLELMHTHPYIVRINYYQYYSSLQISLLFILIKLITLGLKWQLSLQAHVHTMTNTSGRMAMTSVAFMKITVGYGTLSYKNSQKTTVHLMMSLNGSWMPIRCKFDKFLPKRNYINVSLNISFSLNYYNGHLIIKF